MQSADMIRHRLMLATLGLKTIDIQVTRPVPDEYAQPTNEEVPVGTLTGWRCGGQHRRVVIDMPGARIERDREYLLVIWTDKLPAIKQGDRFEHGGKTYRIGDIDELPEVSRKYYFEEA